MFIIFQYTWSRFTKLFPIVYILYYYYTCSFFFYKLGHYILIWREYSFKHALKMNTSIKTKETPCRYWLPCKVLQNGSLSRISALEKYIKILDPWRNNPRTPGLSDL